MNFKFHENFLIVQGKTKFPENIGVSWVFPEVDTLAIKRVEENLTVKNVRLLTILWPASWRCNASCAAFAISPPATAKQCLASAVLAAGNISCNRATWCHEDSYSDRKKLYKYLKTLNRVYPKFCKKNFLRISWSFRLKN